MAKPLKIAIGTIMLIVSGLIGYLAIGVLFFAYSDSTLSSGCEGEFCIEHSKAEVEALFEKKYSFDSGVMVPYNPTLRTHQTSEYISTNTPNTFDELRATDRWTVCLLYTSPSPRDQRGSRMPSSA